MTKSSLPKGLRPEGARCGLQPLVGRNSIHIFCFSLSPLGRTSFALPGEEEEEEEGRLASPSPGAEASGNHRAPSGRKASVGRHYSGSFSNSSSTALTTR